VQSCVSCRPRSTHRYTGQARFPRITLVGRSVNRDRLLSGTRHKHLIEKAKIVHLAHVQGFAWVHYTAVKLQPAAESGEGSVMEVFVKFEVFDTIYDREDVLALRQAVGQNMQRFQQSGKVKEFRAFSDARGGFMLVDIDSGGELRELLGITMLDHFHIETHPVTTAEELAEFFEQDAAAG